MILFKCAECQTVEEPNEDTIALGAASGGYSINLCSIGCLRKFMLRLFTIDKYGFAYTIRKAEKEARV